MSEDVDTAGVTRRLRRDVDQQGIYSAETSQPWTAQGVTELVDQCLESTCRRFGDENLRGFVVDAEVSGYMQGFVAGRGFEPDIVDLLLAALAERLA